MDNLVTARAMGDPYTIAAQRKEFFDEYMPHFHNIYIDEHAGSGVDNEVNKKLAEDTGYKVDVEWDLNPDSNYEGYGVPEFMEFPTVSALAGATISLDQMAVQGTVERTSRVTDSTTAVECK